MLLSPKEPPSPMMAVERREQHLKRIVEKLSPRADLPAAFAGPGDICSPHVGFWQPLSPLSASSIALAGNG